MRLIDTDNAWGIGILQDWYIHSVNPDDIPQWTDEHIKELCKDFYVIPKETTKYNIDCNLNRLKELAEADKEGRCIILSEIKGVERISEKEVVATCDIKYCLDYGEYIIGYLFKNNLSDTGYSCENDYDTMLDVTHYGMLPKIVKEGEE